jgi:hypothetical protein
MATTTVAENARIRSQGSIPEISAFIDIKNVHHISGGRFI